ncbi:MAG TPA: hypothetical protein VF235_05355 [Actinomycetota bacterium]
MRTIRWLLAAGFLLGAVLDAHVAVASAWTDANCDGGARSMTTWKRSQAIAYVQPPLLEGYELGGGCFRLNDRDDTPSLPADGGGEGADCSGFVFRVWALKNDGSNGFRFWDHDKEMHGPYATFHYYDPSGETPFRQISKSFTATMPMDAFVWYRGSDDKHIALLYSQSTTSDLMIHAHNNTVGVEISEEIYRQYPDVKAISRRAWTLECYPKCPGTGTLR